MIGCEPFQPPANWQDFENMCIELFELKFNRTFEKRGRAGQKQNGYDLFSDEKGILYGIECKKRVFENPLTKTTVNEIFDEILTSGKIFHNFVIATTTKTDKNIQDHISELMKKPKYSNIKKCTIFFWDQIFDILMKNTNVLVKYYAHFLETVEAVKQLPLSLPDSQQILKFEKREELPSILAHFLEGINLHLTRPNDEYRRIFGLLGEYIDNALAHAGARNFRIESSRSRLSVLHDGSTFDPRLLLLRSERRERGGTKEIRAFTKLYLAKYDLHYRSGTENVFSISQRFGNVSEIKGLCVFNADAKVEIYHRNEVQVCNECAFYYLIVGKRAFGFSAGHNAIESFINKGHDPSKLVVFLPKGDDALKVDLMNTFNLDSAVFY